MNSKRHYLTEAILNRLRATWTDAVAAGLRGASEVELLWLLDEIEAQLGQRTVAWSSPTAPPDEWDDIPDWDDKTPEELDAIARDLEDQLGADEGDAAMSLHGAEGPRPRCLPLRRRADKSPTRLACEELEPRFPPSSFSLLRVEGATAEAVPAVCDSIGGVVTAGVGRYAGPAWSALADSNVLDWVLTHCQDEWCDDATVGDLADALVA